MPVNAGPLTSHSRVSSAGSSDRANSARVTPSPKLAQPQSDRAAISKAMPRFVVDDLTTSLLPVSRLVPGAIRNCWMRFYTARVTTGLSWETATRRRPCADGITYRRV